MTPPFTIGIVIPYYQREAGILARALRSVARQHDVQDVLVVVVDDASPAPAAQDIAQIQQGFPFALEVIVQPNGGPGAARNRALEALVGRVRYVAFLDSDDEWSDDHLARALLALQQGCDVYFADLLQLGAEVSAFRHAGRIDPAQHPSLASADHLHAYQGDMLEQILFGNVIGTPTVVYDFTRFAAVRFRPEFRNAGEDYLFWLDLTQASARFCFSANCEAICGRGVNVYSGAGWGTETHFLRLHNEMRYRKRVLQEFPITASQRVRLNEQIAQLRQSMVRDLLHRLAHRKPLPWQWMWDQMRLDLKTYLFMPWLALAVMFEK
ncbi:MAG TPA: glycosyltransferase family 2 protein [Candidatus Competibacteraceae bacterium]|nr:glycosyltransferase family 2 protein [Candidatus Competibacteraceae bacterium]